MRFQPIYGRQAFKVDGKFKFWGGLTVEAWGGGPGLVEALSRACAREAASRSATTHGRCALVHDDDGVHGVRCRARPANASI